MTLIFATNNKHKLNEIRNLLEPAIKILSLSDINFNEELEETNPTIEGNASQKSWYVFNKVISDKSYLLPDSGHLQITGCFADDTGLEIEALDGRPGVYSARYAGEHCSFEDNIAKVLHELKGIKNRNAKFRCVLSLIMDGKETQFEGVMNGSILTEKIGNEGFGYDPIFAPNQIPLSKKINPLSFSHGECVRRTDEVGKGLGLSRIQGREVRSFAQMTLAEKNLISHRAVATKKLAEYLLKAN